MRRCDGRGLTVCANRVVQCVGVVILAALVWYALRFTQYMEPVAGYEYPVDSRDSVWQNLLCALLVFAVFAGGKALEERMGERTQRIVCRVTAGIAMLWQGVWSFLWVLAADRPPGGDQDSVLSAAIGFLEGNYGALGEGGYCEIYPHQLGLASLEELIFRISGGTDYHVMQWILAAMAVGTVYCVYGILKDLSGRTAVVVPGTLLAGLCTAPILYSSWIYGESPYVFFTLLAARMLARYGRKKTVGALAGVVAAMTLAVLVRKNAMILILAFCLVGAVSAFAKRDKKLLCAMVLAVLVPALCYAGIYKMYELRSGYEHAKGMPVYGHMYIGLQESEGRCGWYYLYCTNTYYENDRDTDRARAAYGELIAQRWSEMRDTPGYTTWFFKNKILSQWNAPLYQSVYFNFVHGEVHYPKVTAFLDRLSGDLFGAVLWVADRLQFVIYLGMLLYFAVGIRRDSDPLRHLLAVTVIGGFLFSVMWEAKTRYAFPCYMMMFPPAAIGYRELAERLWKVIGSYREKKAGR
ncbi:MAG: hypothetical protein NC079_08150 [Clostridium sp.]|nr:hypothetical protein [Acetatifactor muris]MCM1527369.1 hypothetical protein [Bacteroides sp.]MCM1563567.1 hypothetical protein [Clostridium sp.]